MVDYIINEGIHFRGFFSNYLTIINSFKVLQHNGILSANIKLGPKLFRLYGEADNWFDSTVCGQIGIDWDSLQDFGLSKWPTVDELTLYSNIVGLIPWNARVTSLISIAKQKTHGCTIGVHFRGTDHNINDGMHGSRVELDIYKTHILEQCSRQTTNKIFVCTDEQGIVENLHEWAGKTLPNVTLYYNNFCKTPNRQGLHWQGSPFNKIQLADEVIQDMMCLAQCQVIIGKTSNVSTVARIYNPNVQMVYCDQP